MKRIIGNIPNRDIREQLEKAIDRARVKGGIYSFEHLLSQTGPIPPEFLSMVLSLLVEQGIVECRIRVLSPETKGVLGSFESLEDVPPTIADDTVQPPRERQVTPDMLEVVYKFYADSRPNQAL